MGSQRVGHDWATELNWNPVRTNFTSFHSSSYTALSLFVWRRWCPISVGWLNACSLSCSLVSNSISPETAARQAPLSMGFSRQQYWSRLCASAPARNLPDPGIKPLSPMSPSLADEFFATSASGEPLIGWITECKANILGTKVEQIISVTAAWATYFPHGWDEIERQGTNQALMWKFNNKDFHQSLLNRHANQSRFYWFKQLFRKGCEIDSKNEHKKWNFVKYGALNWLGGTPPIWFLRSLPFEGMVQVRVRKMGWASWEKCLPCCQQDGSMSRGGLWGRLGARSLPAASGPNPPWRRNFSHFW